MLVSAGTYFENINFRGKAIVVGSQFLLDRDPVHIEQTVIDGSTAADPDSASVVTFDSGEDTTSVLMGLTLTGGTGSYNPAREVRGGGGILVGIDAGGKIAHNRIVSNEITFSTAYGGGIVVESPENSVLIIRNVIADNLLTGSDSGGGGGIFHYSDPAHHASGKVVIAENIITDNTATDGTRMDGGGIDINSTSPVIRNNLIARNRANHGGGVNYHNFSWAQVPHFVNNTVVRNIARVGGGFYSDQTNPDDLSPRVHNSIVWGNEASFFPQISPDFTVSYSDVEGGYVGANNTDQDPLFADTTTYALSASSPCIDAGDPNALYNDSADPGNPGQPIFPGQGTLRNDMGAYGGNASVLISVGISNPVALPEQYRLSQNYPNPFNPSTTIAYLLTRPADVILTVYDLLGQQIRVLVAGPQPAGWYEVSFDAAGLSSGTYLYRLQAEGFVETRRMVVVK